MGGTEHGSEPAFCDRAGVVNSDDGPPDLPGWWKGLVSVVLMLVTILTMSFIFERMPSFGGDTPVHGPGATIVGWLLFLVMLVAFLLGMAAIFFAVFGGLGTLMTRASLWVYRSRWRGQASARAEVAALAVEVRALRQELDAGKSSIVLSPRSSGLSAQHQGFDATEGSGRPARAMRTEVGDDAAADRAARIATDKAAARGRPGSTGS